VDILARIGVIVAGNVPKDELDAYLKDVRESLATSNKQFIALPLLAIVALVTYHLAVYEGLSTVSYSNLQIGGVPLFRKVFLVVPSLLLTYSASIGYLRRCQREAYDYLAIARSRLFGATGLHELRLPSDHILGLFLLHHQAGWIGKMISGVTVYLAVMVEIVGPVVYITHAAAENVAYFGPQDVIGILGSSVAITLCAIALLTIAMATRVKV
jgi:hypothetical protein